MTEHDAKETAKECWQFIDGCQTLFMASINNDRSPHASYAPYVQDGSHGFCIFVSNLSAHTANLKTLRPVAIMLVEDEAKTHQIYARKRGVFECAVEALTRESESGRNALQGLRARFGEVIELLESLADFMLFTLRPQNGTYVKGFGQAYKLLPPEFEQAEHIVPGKKSAN